MADDFNRYDVYTTIASKYCYPYSSVLRNRFNIRDLSELKTVEADIFAIKQKQLFNEPLQGTLSPSHLCRLHRFLFSDLYSFAGHYRTEDISKGMTLFMHYEQIPGKLSELLLELKKEKYLRETPNEQLHSRFAYYLATLNYIHPFREGNGRTTREFIRLLMIKNQIYADWSKIDHEYLLKLMEASVYDYSVLIPAFNLITVPFAFNC